MNTIHTTIESTPPFPSEPETARAIVDGPAQERIQRALASSEVAHAYRSESDPSVSLEIAALTAGIFAVRGAITFTEHAPTPWQQPTDKRGNCINFAWATSGVVEDLGMTSRVAHCNGHVLNVVVGRSQAIHVINSDDLPHAWYFDVAREGRGALFDCQTATAIRNISDEDTITATLDTQYLEQQVHAHRQKSGNHKVTAKMWMAARNAGITIMSPFYAAQALQNRTSLIHGLQRNDLEATAAALQRMQNHNFDRESRPEINTIFEMFLRTSRYWSRDMQLSEGSIGSALNAYDAILDDSYDKQVRLGDAWRYLAECRSSPESLSRAESYYRVASLYARPNSHILTGKIRAIADQRKKMSLCSTTIRTLTNSNK